MTSHLVGLSMRAKPNRKMGALCSKKTMANGSSYISRPPYDGEPFFINSKQKSCKLTWKLIFLLEGISPLFNHNNRKKIRCYDQFLLRLFFTLSWSLNLLINVRDWNLPLRVDRRVDLLNEKVSEAIVWKFFHYLTKDSRVSRFQGCPSLYTCFWTCDSTFLPDVYVAILCVCVCVCEKSLERNML